jgi:hypothetical protein
MAPIKKSILLVVAGVLLASCFPAVAASAEGDGAQREQVGAGQAVAAAFSNIIYVPMKAVVFCPVSGGLWVAAMLVTGGTHYNEAADFAKAGCGGKWVIKPEDIRLSE